MIKRLRHRFILYNMLVISSSILIIGIAILLGSDQHIAPHRLLVTGILAILVVYISSLIISIVAIAPIKKAWQQQIDFAADASHELRTPLAVIQTNLELVLDYPQDSVAEQARWLNNSLFETRRMSKIVNDLLILSRADTKPNNINPTVFNLSLILESTLDSLESLAAKKNILLQRSIPTDVYLLGDSDLLRQLVIILTDNAIKYTTPPGSVNVLLSKNERKVILKVSDTGNGISSTDLEHIFDRFYCADKARSRNEGGTGLGLSIAKWIVDSHHGNLKVRSTIGVGTEFIVSLPSKINESVV